MATLRKKKNRGGYTYFVDFTYQGKRYRKSTKTSDRKLAELFLKDIEVKIAKESFGFCDLKKKRIRLTEFFDKYLQHSKATKAKNTFLLDTHASRVFIAHTGDMQIKSVTFLHVEEFKVSRLKEHRPASVNLELRHLKAAFNVALKWGYIERNPFLEVKQIKIKGNNLPKFLSKEEVGILLEKIPEGLFRNLIIFYLHTGCRRNEALGLDWKDISFDSRTVKFRETKSGESRIVPANSVLIKMLSSMERAGERPFPFRPHFVTHKFKDYLKSAGINGWDNLSLHSLRHTFASHLVMDGVDLYTVSRLLGHSSVKVTQMYAHLAPDYLKMSVERLRY